MSVYNILKIAGTDAETSFSKFFIDGVVPRKGDICDWVVSDIEEYIDIDINGETAPKMTMTFKLKVRT